MLSVRGLTKRYGGPRPRTVFADVDLALDAGDYVAVMGESGIGKSTLLNLIAGLDSADSGSIKLGAIELTTLDDDALTLLRRAQMGFVFQAFHILPYLDVFQNVALPLSLLGTAGDETERRVSAMLAAVGLAERGASPPRELSGGELQRVAIARALVHSPGLVLADEPTGNLDADSAGQVLRLLRDQIKASGAAGILVTHSSVAAATAVVEFDAKLFGRDEALSIVGIDAFRAAPVEPGLVADPEDRLDLLRPDTLFLSPATAQWLAADPGATLAFQSGLHEVRLRVAGTLSASSHRRFAVMDIAGAQSLFDRAGVLTRIDLRLRPGVDIAAL